MSCLYSLACPVCQLLSTAPCRTVNDFKLFKCIRCSHIWQYPSEIRAKYDQDYVASRYDAYSTTESMSWLRLGLVRAFVDGGRLLDIGYGNGSFIKVAEKANFEAFGADVHGLGERYGVTEAPINKGKWDVVTLFDSLEHFDDLSVIKAINSTFIVVSTPHRPSNFPTFLDWKHFRPGEHLHYFSKMSLSMLFPSHELVLTTNIEDSIRGACCIPTGDGSVATDTNIITCVFGPSRHCTCNNKSTKLV